MADAARAGHPVADAHWLARLTRRQPIEDLPEPGSVEVLALRESQLAELKPLLRLLEVTGWDVSVTWWDEEGRAIEDRQVSGLTARDGAVVEPAGVRPEGRLGRLSGLLTRRPRIDPSSVSEHLAGRWRAKDTLVPLDEPTRVLLDKLPGGWRAVRPLRELAATVLTRMAARGVVRASDVDAVRAGVACLDRDDLPVAGWTALAVALLSGSHFGAVTSLAARGAELGVAPESGLAALAAIAALSAGGEAADVAGRTGVDGVAERTVEEANAALTAGDIDRAVLLTSLAQRIVFHRELHTSTPSSPLVTEPRAQLDRLAGSQVLGRLMAPGGGDRERVMGRGGSGADDGPHRKGRAVVLPGAYPSFADAVVRVLEPAWTTDVLRLGAADVRFGNTETDATVLRELWDLLEGRPESAVVRELRESIETTDLVFADWADKGAVLASRLVPPSARLVVRLHGVDTLSAWVHLVDWSRVDAVVFVSEHLRASMLPLLGTRLDGAAQHVVPHAVDVERFAVGPVDSSPTDSGVKVDRVLGLLGWAQRVKDPIFALEVLGRLRSHDPAWRLRLVGPDFATTGTRSELEYAQAFRDRMLHDDVLGGLDFVGQVERAAVPEALSGIGFALSTSVRESWHLGAMEMLAGGAVPVIRDWPLYARFDAARGLFPSDSVVVTPEEAAERILGIAADVERYQQERAAARRFVESRYAPAEIDRRLRAAITGTA